MDKKQDMALIFGQKLKKLMQDKKVSANELSNNIGTDRASIGRYFKGESSPRIDTFLSICDALHVQPNYFLDADFNDYSLDESRTEERKLIESLYCLCKYSLISDLTNNNYGYCNDICYSLRINRMSLLEKILLECLRYAKSDLADDIQMCKKIADKYEPMLIEQLKTNDQIDK